MENYNYFENFADENTERCRLSSERHKELEKRADDALKQDMIDSSEVAAISANLNKHNYIWTAGQWWVYDELDRRWKEDTNAHINQWKKTLEFLRDKAVEQRDEARKEWELHRHGRPPKHGPIDRLLSSIAMRTSFSRALAADTATYLEQPASMWLDNDRPYLLNTPDYLIDMRDFSSANELADEDGNTYVEPDRAVNFQRHMTAVTPVEGPCPRWLSFLNHLTGSDDRLISYLQRILGLSISGDSSGQACFFLIGPGKNGKSRVPLLLNRLLGDYAITVPAATLVGLGRRPGGADPDLLMFEGRRVVTVGESESNAPLATATLKSLTGDDVISARTLWVGVHRQFTSHAKLWWTTNHPPNIRDTDEGTWRRIRLINVTNTIADPIPNFDKVLFDEEGPQILAWMIRGYQEFLKLGNDNPPPHVVNAVSRYRDTEDTLTAFVKECCDVDPTLRVLLSAFVHAHNRWAGQQQQDRKTPKDVVRWLECNGDQRYRLSIHENRGRSIVGLGLKDLP